MPSKCHLVFGHARQSTESIVAQALLPAASTLVSTLGISVRRFGKMYDPSANNISSLKCPDNQKLSDIGMPSCGGFPTRNSGAGPCPAASKTEQRRPSTLRQTPSSTAPTTASADR
jgi:hypothetical protein